MISLALIFATVALLPIDIFLVSSTVDSDTGLKKLWADKDTIYWMTFTVQIMYYGKHEYTSTVKSRESEQEKGGGDIRIKIRVRGFGEVTMVTNMFLYR